MAMAILPERGIGELAFPLSRAEVCCRRDFVIATLLVRSHAILLLLSSRCRAELGVHLTERYEIFTEIL